MPIDKKRLQLPQSTTALSSLSIPSGSNPTSPSSGDIWRNGTELPFYDGTNGHELLPQLFTGAGTYIPPPGVTSVFLTGCAAGAGGGNGDAISFVQSATGFTASGSSFTITLSSTPVNGNTIIVSAVTTGTISSISQTGVTWTKDVAQTPGGTDEEFWHGNVGASPGSVITVNLSGGTIGSGIAWEFSGLTSSPYDIAANNTGTSTAPDSGTTGTTSQAVELYLAFWSQSGTGQTFSSATNSFTGLVQSTNTGHHVFGGAYKIVGATGTADSAVTSSASAVWWGSIATYKGAGVAGAGGAGAGACCLRYEVPVTPGTSYAVNPGAAGTAGVNGGNTTFGSLLTLGGGVAGAAAIGGTFGAGGNGGIPILGAGFSGAGGGAGSQVTSTAGNGGGYNASSAGGATDGASGAGLTFSQSGGQGGQSLNDGGGGGASLCGSGGLGGHGFDGVGGNANGYGAGGGGGAAGGSSSPGFIQAASTGFSGVTSTTVTLGNTPVNSNTLLLGINKANAAQIISVTSTGATWVRDSSFTSAFSWTMDVWRATNVQSAGTVITITFSASTQGVAISEEWNNLQTTTIEDLYASNTGTSTTVDSGTTGTTNSANELVIAALTASVSSIGSPSNSFTNVNSVTIVGQTSVMEYKSVSSTGTQNTSATITSAVWTGAIATFRRSGTASLIANTSGSAGTGASSIGLTVTAPTNGNTGFLTIYSSSSTYVSSIVQTGAVWRLAAIKQNGGIFVWIFYASNFQSAGTSLTINFSATGSDVAANYAEFSGVATTDPLDQLVTNSTGPLTTPATASTGTTGTTANANELGWGVIDAYPSANNGTGAQSSPTNGYTIQTSALDDGVSNKATMVTVNKALTSTGTQQTTTTITSGSQPFYTMSTLLTYNASSSGAGGAGGNGSQGFLVVETF